LASNTTRWYVALERSEKVQTMLWSWTTDSLQQTFAKTDLPKEHRILKPDSMKTMDYKPERLNIHVGEDGTVQKTSQG
jgi:hypothetical protein